MTTYSAGLRLNEVIRLRVGDVDSSRMTIRVEQGKGGKDRYTVLSRRLLEALRDYWKIARPATWLFPSQETGQPNWLIPECIEVSALYSPRTIFLPWNASAYLPSAKDSMPRSRRSA